MATPKQPDITQLVRVDGVPAQVTPPPNQSSVFRASLVGSQQTETDSLAQLYKGTPLPVVRHAPFNATTNPVIGAAANSAAKNAVDEALTVLTLPFGSVTSGDNTRAAMTVDNGAYQIPHNEGIVGANQLFNESGAEVAPICGAAPTHPGEVLISQPDGSAAFADPLVQGLYAAGSSIFSPPAYIPPTTIQPVLIGGSDYASGGSPPATPALQTWKVDAKGYGYVAVESASQSGNAPVALSVGVSSVQVLAANASRKGVNITNTGSDVVCLSFGTNAAVLYSGVVLWPAAAFWFDLNDFTTAAINAVASDANGSLAVQEWQ